jgi:hypothetical protein
MSPPDEPSPPSPPSPPEPEHREADLRRADFRGGTPVTMADGQDWTLPLPVITITATDDAIGFADESDIGRDFDALLREMEDARTDRDLFSAFCRVARTLLLINYDLPPGTIGRLVRFPKGAFWDDPVVQAVIRVSHGLGGPKPDAASSDST